MSSTAAVAETIDTTTTFADIATLSAADMLRLRARADARVDDILGFAATVDERDWYLRHYDAQRQECCQEGDIKGAILAEFILTNLERALATH